MVALLGLTNRQGDFFFKADTTKQHFTLGCNHSHSLTSLHSIETVYDHTKSTNGLFGQPFWINFAGEYALSPAITLKSKITAKDELGFAMAWIHKFD